MAVLNARDLLRQARFLNVPRQPGPPLQVDVRRAISAAYYAVFHHVLTAAADALIGKSRRDARYALVYRSIDHGALKEACQTAQAAKPPSGFGQPGPAKMFSLALREFSKNTIDLQARRHTADYDPTPLIRTSDAIVAIEKADTAVLLFDGLAADERLLFITLLAFKRRR